MDEPKFTKKDLPTLRKVMELMPEGYWGGVPYILEDIIARVEGRPKPKRKFVIEG